jgi:GTP-binding protein HflX
VGFIEDLPQTLVRAFKSTLEELDEAHLLLHVLDASDPGVEQHLVAVDQILGDLRIQDKPLVRVWNKAEAADTVRLRSLLDQHGGFAISALTSLGLEGLLLHMERALFRSRAASQASDSTED